MHVADYQLLATATAKLGESPWWDAAAARLWWVDIFGQQIRHSGLDGVEGEPVDTGSDIGFAAPDDGGGIVAGLREGLFRRSAAGEWTRLWAADYDTGDHRINDGKADRAGRLWFGTIHDSETEPTSAFYRLADDGVRSLFGGLTTSNGLGWSPDNSAFYLTDSPVRTIWVFDFDFASGELSNRRVFAQDPSAYTPDGLTVDAEGCVWSAKWDGYRIVRYRPDGRVEREFELPVRKPTCATFVGDGLSTLAVTSANLSPADGPLAGSIFLIDTTTSGIPDAWVNTAYL